MSRICENCAFNSHKQICRMCDDLNKHIYDIELDEIIAEKERMEGLGDE